MSCCFIDVHERSIIHSLHVKRSLQQHIPASTGLHNPTWPFDIIHWLFECRLTTDRWGLVNMGVALLLRGRFTAFRHPLH